MFYRAPQKDPGERLVDALVAPSLRAFDIRCAAVVTDRRVDARVVVVVRHGLVSRRIAFTPLAAALTAFRLESEPGLAHGRLYAAALRRAVHEAEHRIDMVRESGTIH